MPEKPMHSLAQNMHNFAAFEPQQETLAPPAGVLLADYFHSPPGYATRRSAGTRDWLIFYTVGGAGRYRLGAKTLLARAGDVMLYAPGTPHDYATEGGEEWCFYWAHFIPRAAWLDWLRLPQALPGLAAFSLPAGAGPQVEAAFRRMVRESAERRPFQEDLAQNALEEALLRIAQQQHRPSQRFSDPRAGLIHDFLEQNCTRAVSLAEIAALVALSPWRVSHLYKSQTGQTITEAVAQLRLRQAARLLAYTSRTVAEIAADVGFQSPFYFSRAFKKAYSAGPLEYRRAARSAVSAAERGAGG